MEYTLEELKAKRDAITSQLEALGCTVKAVRKKPKAIIHKHAFTGEQRVFFEKIVNRKKRVCKKTSPFSSFTVTGYPDLTTLYYNSALKRMVPVWEDEQVNYNGLPCEDQLFA